MRILVISDIHGRDDWKLPVKNHKEYDKIVFLGDYVDSFDKTNIEIFDNLEQIIEFKRSNMDKIVLLYGNHDMQYTIPFHTGRSIFSCSGYRGDMHYDLHDLFSNNKDLFQNAYQHDNWIFIHAGIHDGWFKYSFKGDYNKNIAYQLNNPKDENQYLALYHVGWLRGGSQYIGGIFWADKQEMKKPLKGYNQVVGHTTIKNLQQYKYKDSVVWFTDTENKEHLILEI